MIKIHDAILDTRTVACTRSMILAEISGRCSCNALTKFSFTKPALKKIKKVNPMFDEYATAFGLIPEPMLWERAFHHLHSFQKTREGNYPGSFIGYDCFYDAE
jgi:hypothetical protein